MASPTPTAPPAGFGQPSPQVVGAGGSDPAADIRNAAVNAAARQGAEQAAASAKYGITEVKLYIQENPASVKVFCFVIGLVLVAFSVLGLFNIFGGLTHPREYLSNIYNVVFGIVICICDGKESWMKSCFDVQGRLFKHAYFLATQSGRAMFYFYIGSMTMLVSPDNVFWELIYIILGAVLCLLAIFMLVIDWCGDRCGCTRQYTGGAMS